MNFYIDRSRCHTCLGNCERRIARLIRCPLEEDRPCITAIEANGRPELILVMEDTGHKAILVLGDPSHELAAAEGLSRFLPRQNRIEAVG